MSKFFVGKIYDDYDGVEKFEVWALTRKEICEDYALITLEDANQQQIELLEEIKSKSISSKLITDIINAKIKELQDE